MLRITRLEELMVGKDVVKAVVDGVVVGSVDVVVVGDGVVEVVVVVARK